MKNKKAYFTAAGVAAALLMFIGCGERTGEKDYNKAMDAWQSGELARAEGLMENAIRKTPGNEKKSVAWNQLGLILWELGKVEEAAEAFNESCALAESLSGANLNLGVSLYHAGRYDEAEVALNNVLGEDPKNPTALAMLGMIAAQKQDWVDAARALGSAANVNPRDPAGINAYALAELSQNRASAVNRLKSLVSTYPDYAPAAYNLGMIHEQILRDPQAALGWYRQYLQKAGTTGSHVEAANQAIARLTGEGQPARPKTDPVAAKRFTAEGVKQLTAGKYNAAITNFEQAIAADPNQKESHYNMGYAYFQLKKYDQAAAAFQNAIKIDPAYADARYNLAFAYCQQRNWRDAERQAKELVKLDKTRGEQMLNYISENRKR